LISVITSGSIVKIYDILLLECSYLIKSSIVIEKFDSANISLSRCVYYSIISSVEIVSSPRIVSHIYKPLARDDEPYAWVKKPE